LDQVVIIGGWAHRPYRFHPLAQHLDYPPLMTLDADGALPGGLKVKGRDIHERLTANGFRAELLGHHKPPATHYHLSDQSGGFYAEFLTPLIGGAYARGGKKSATTRIAGVTSQHLLPFCKGKAIRSGKDDRPGGEVEGPRAEVSWSIRKIFDSGSTA
jgi:hypothetical protein